MDRVARLLGPLSVVCGLIVATQANPMPPPTSDEVTRLVAGDGDYFFYSVQVQGQTAVVGMPHDDLRGADSGSVHFFLRQMNHWAHQGQLVAAEGKAEDYFGTAVALQGDTLMVGATGAHGSDRSSGAVFVFTRIGDDWTQQQRLDPGSEAGIADFGTWIALAPNAVLVGATSAGAARDRDKSVAYVFLRTDDRWTRRGILTGITRTGVSRSTAAIKSGLEPPYKKFESREVEVSLKGEGPLSEPDVEGCLVEAAYRGLWIDESDQDATFVPYSLLRLLQIRGQCPRSR